MGFLTVIYFDNDRAVSGRSTTAYETMDQAEIQYHTALASAMSKEDYSKIIALVFDEEARIVFRRVWERPVAEEASAEEVETVTEESAIEE